MKTFHVTEAFEGRKLGKYVTGLLPKIKKSLLEKSLRKKNITVNGKKARSNYVLKADDTVEIYFSDETIDKLSSEKIQILLPKLEPVYETQDVLVYNKPAGLLTQRDRSGQASLTDIAKKRVASDRFNVAPLNRLDRNTTGIVVFAKNYKTQRELSDLLQNHGSAKKYRAIVKGEVKDEVVLKDRYEKRSDNTAVLEGEREVELTYRPVKSNGSYSLLEIDLKTGKSHQIRAQLCGHGLPIIGDPKYGDREENKKFKDLYGLDHQLLHAFNYSFSRDDKTVLEVSADPDEVFGRIESDLF